LNLAVGKVYYARSEGHGLQTKGITALGKTAKSTKGCSKAHFDKEKRPFLSEREN